MRTEDEDYTSRLLTLQTVWWKRVLDVQAPYRWNLRRQGLGRTLDVGCGLGRNLRGLPLGSVGVDHNAASVRVCREAGYEAYTPNDFHARATEGSFDAMLLAHVAEHLDPAAQRGLLAEYLPYVRSGGRVFFITPQERGYASDATHVEFVDAGALSSLARDAGLLPERPFSFPFPRWAGRAFTYNEFCLAATKP